MQMDIILYQLAVFSLSQTFALKYCKNKVVMETPKYQKTLQYR